MDASSLTKSLDKFDFDSFPDEASRKEALTAARALVTRLETPIETVVHMSHEIPALNAALRFAIDRGVFEKLAKDPTTPKSPEELSGADASPVLVDRFLKHLASMNIIRPAGANLYLPTRHSISLVDPTIYAAVDYYRDVTSKAFISLPNFASSIKYADPTTVTQSNWHFLLGRDESHFEWLGKNPEIMKNFGNLMAGYTAQRGSWLDAYNGKELLEKAKPDVPILVDVGGGIGQDISKYLKAFPSAADRLILQDLPDVTKDAAVPSAITAQGHDFFTPQPVQGARAYFLHSVLHDWPDDKCIEILKNLKPAMTPGYSRLLINEMVIPSSNPTAYGTTLDMTMFALFNAKERTEEDWKALLATAGFKIIKIWQSLAAAEAVVEAELVTD